MVNNSQSADHGLMLDLKVADLKTEVADLLGIEYMSEAASLQIPKVVEGILWGPCHWPVVCLPAQLQGGPIINLFMLVDTFAQATKLSISALTSLGCNHITAAATVNLGGYRTHVQLCDQGKHINILGSDFLSKNRCMLKLDYWQDKLAIHFP